MKKYLFIFIDIHGDMTHETIYNFNSMVEARKHAKELIANTKDNTEDIKIKLIM